MLQTKKSNILTSFFKSQISTSIQKVTCVKQDGGVFHNY